MPIVRFSGVIEGRSDPNRNMRAQLLYRLFDAGWNIYNGNGDQVVTLGNIQKKITESNAFVFTPGAKLADMFNAASIFVGFQTMDKDLNGTTAVILNSGKSWNIFADLVEHLHKMGTVSQSMDTFLTVAKDPDEVVSAIEGSYLNEVREPQESRYIPDDIISETKPDFNVCVFCSASIQKKDYLYDGYHLGKDLADNGWGCVSGAGCTGIMGEVVKGSNDHGGWTGGSNVPHIIEMEGLPEGLDDFWPRPDIYTRMEVMIEHSDAFVVMPGGMGTVQETLALVLLKKQDHKLMKNKKIVIVNRTDVDGVNFWDPLLKLLEAHGVSDMFTVINHSKDVVAALQA